MPACQLASRRELSLLYIYMARLFAPPKTSLQGEGSSFSDVDEAAVNTATSYCSLGKTPSWHVQNNNLWEFQSSCVQAEPGTLLEAK